MNAHASNIERQFNFSEWAITHPVLIVFAMLLLTVAGAYSYSRSVAPKTLVTLSD
jgi:hypothetical protein